jgi:hypothetical protein
MATAYVVWDQEQRRMVEGLGIFRQSADADAATRRHIAKGGNTPEKQSYSTVAVTVTRL